MSEDTITIRKDTFWKYSTFVLAALVVVMGFIMFTDSGQVTGNAVKAGEANPSGAASAVDLSMFLKNPSVYPSLGPENAETVVVEFSDFQCPYCALASGLPEWTSQYATQYSDLVGAAQKIQEKAANGEIRFIYVPMSFLGQESVYAAQAGLCANRQDKFWEMHDAIFFAHDSKENNGKYTKENLIELAGSVDGIDIDSFSTCLNNDETLDDVKQAASEARTAASGTPTFYVNGEKVPASWTQISALIS